MKRLERRVLDGLATPDTLPAGLEQRVVTDRLEVRVEEGQDGSFDGLALPWSTTDSYGTRFAPGAFSAGGLDALPYALLWMHDPFLVLGSFVAEERPEGLHVAGRYDETPDGQTARTRARSRSAGELSVGFVRLGVSEDDPDLITQARLVEVSQITARMASVPGAALADVRRADEERERFRVLAEVDMGRRLAAARLRLVGEPRS